MRVNHLPSANVQLHKDVCSRVCPHFVVCADSLEILGWVNMLQSLADLLKPGGVLLIHIYLLGDHLGV